MDYYVKSSGLIATFMLLDAKKRQKIAGVDGSTEEFEPLKLKNPPSGVPPGYPKYEIITANGITEIIEHRQMEPIFYITDDPAVWSELEVPH